MGVVSLFLVSLIYLKIYFFVENFYVNFCNISYEFKLKVNEMFISG